MGKSLTFIRSELVMVITNHKKSKANEDFWEKVWQATPLGKYQGIERYLAINKKLDCLFRRFLEKSNKKILEIGCARGKQLIYFAREFGYDVYGIDYSPKGVELANQNLKSAGIDGTILCEDVFITSFKEESFDIVYSMGLIEHFQNPSDIIDAHIKLLKKGGKLIMTVPNFSGVFYLTLIKVLGKKRELLATHNLSIIDKEALNEALRGRGIKILTLNYFGPIDFTLAFSGVRVRLVLYLMHFLNQVAGYMTFFMPPSRYFSPYLVLVGEKTA